MVGRNVSWRSSASVLAVRPSTELVATKLESLGFAQNFRSSCELEALHFIGIRSFGGSVTSRAVCSASRGLNVLIMRAA
jgi:hypothetical protein